MEELLEGIGLHDATMRIRILIQKSTGHICNHTFFPCQEVNVQRKDLKLNDHKQPELGIMILQTHHLPPACSSCWHNSRVSAGYN